MQNNDIFGTIVIYINSLNIGFGANYIIQNYKLTIIWFIEVKIKSINILLIIYFWDIILTIEKQLQE